MSTPLTCEMEVPVELRGFVADVSVRYEFGEELDITGCLEEMDPVEIHDNRITLNGSFELAELLALAYFLDRGY